MHTLQMTLAGLALLALFAGIAKLMSGPNNAGYSSVANFLFRVSDGRIVSWQMRY